MLEFTRVVCDIGRSCDARQAMDRVKYGNIIDGVDREDADDLVPGQVGVGFPSHDFVEGFCKKLCPFKGLLHGVRLAGKTACPRVPALVDGAAAIDFIFHKVANGDRVGRVCLLLVERYPEAQRN